MKKIHASILVLVIVLIAVAMPAFMEVVNGAEPGIRIDLTPILQAVIALLAALVTYKVIPWIKARTNAAQFALLGAVVKTAVAAAEQVYGAGGGTDKMAYVKEYLAGLGYDVDVETIEAAVQQLTLDQACISQKRIE